MFKRIKLYILGWQYRRAIRKAARLSAQTGLRYYVLNIDGHIRVAAKQAIKEMVRRRRFRKGVTVEDIERRALFITK